jgi:segregation and condensation protein B
MDLSPSQQLYAILLSEGGEVSKRELMNVWGFDEQKFKTALTDLISELQTGIQILIHNEKSVMLTLRPDVSTYIQGFRKESEGRDIGAAQAEVLACVLYRGPISKSEIDELRGVDSRSSVRELIRRGYIEENKQRQFIASVEALRDLGIERAEDLPDYETISRELEQGEGREEA